MTRTGTLDKIRHRWRQQNSMSKALLVLYVLLVAVLALQFVDMLT